MINEIISGIQQILAEYLIRHTEIEVVNTSKIAVDTTLMSSMNELGEIFK